eukprot:2323394-Rhodomonas_salina.1
MRLALNNSNCVDLRSTALYGNHTGLANLLLALAVVCSLDNLGTRQVLDASRHIRHQHLGSQHTQPSVLSGQLRRWLRATKTIPSQNSK